MSGHGKPPGGESPDKSLHSNYERHLVFVFTGTHGHAANEVLSETPSDIKIRCLNSTQTRCNASDEHDTTQVMGKSWFTDELYA